MYLLNHVFVLSCLLPRMLLFLSFILPCVGVTPILLPTKTYFQLILLPSIICARVVTQTLTLSNASVLGDYKTKLHKSTSEFLGLTGWFQIYSVLKDYHRIYWSLSIVLRNYRGIQWYIKCVLHSSVCLRISVMSIIFLSSKTYLIIE